MNLVFALCKKFTIFFQNSVTFTAIIKQTIKRINSVNTCKKFLFQQSKQE